MIHYDRRHRYVKVPLHPEGIVCWSLLPGWFYGSHLCWHGSRIAYNNIKVRLCVALWYHQHYAFRGMIHTLKLWKPCWMVPMRPWFQWFAWRAWLCICCNRKQAVTKKRRGGERERDTEKGCRHKTDSLKFDVFLLADIGNDTLFFPFLLVIHLRYAHCWHTIDSIRDISVDM